MRKTSEFDNDWNDTTIFEKIPVRKTSSRKRRHPDWKQHRVEARKAKRMTQEKNYA